jgi:hypothetical protein
MLKKSFLIGVLFIGVWAMLISNAQAYPATSGGWGAWPKCVLIWSDWLGVANYEIKPTDVEVTLDLRLAELSYINPGNQDGGVGQPFDPDTVVTGTQALSNPVSKNGKYHSEITFGKDVLLGAIPDASLPPLQNPNWYYNDIVVLKMYVTIRGYSDLDGDGDPETETARVGGTCTLNFDRTEYICVTEEIWRYRK